MGEVDALIQNLSSIDDIKLVLANENKNIDDYSRLATQAKIGEIISGFTNLNGLISIDIYSLTGYSLSCWGYLKCAKYKY